jgi:hypothetical protein
MEEVISTQIQCTCTVHNTANSLQNIAINHLNTHKHTHTITAVCLSVCLSAFSEGCFKFCFVILEDCHAGTKMSEIRFKQSRHLNRSLR